MNQPFQSIRWDKSKRTVDHLSDPAYNNIFLHNTAIIEVIIKPPEDILLDAPAPDQQAQLRLDNENDESYSNDIQVSSDEEYTSKLDAEPLVSSEVNSSLSTTTFSHDSSNSKCLCLPLRGNFYTLKQTIQTSTMNSDYIDTIREEARSLYEQQFSDTTDVWSDALMATITDRDLLCVYCTRTSPGLVNQQQIRKRQKYERLFLQTSQKNINEDEADGDGNPLSTTIMEEDG